MGTILSRSSILACRIRTCPLPASNELPPLSLSEDLYCTIAEAGLLAVILSAHLPGCHYQRAIKFKLPVIVPTLIAAFMVVYPISRSGPKSSDCARPHTDGRQARLRHRGSGSRLPVRSGCRGRLQLKDSAARD